MAAVVLVYLVALPWLADALEDSDPDAVRSVPATVDVARPELPGRGVSVKVPVGWELERSRVGDEDRVHAIDEDLEVWLAVSSGPGNGERVASALAEERRVVEDAGRARFAAPVAITASEGRAGEIMQFSTPVDQGLVAALASGDLLVRARARWLGTREDPTADVLGLLRSVRLAP